MEEKIDIQQPKKILNDNIWYADEEGIKLKPSIRKRLLIVAIDFFKGLKIPEKSVKDIIFTGSLANYNWTNSSDIDLHLVVDYGLIDENSDLLAEYFNAVKNLWNKQHEITIKDFEVEIYVQDSKEEHYASGVYSILKDKWIIEPKYDEPRINEKAIEKKVNLITKLIEKVEDILKRDSYKEAIQYSKLLSDKIKNMRKRGLSKDGEYSIGNLAFKVLRKNGVLQKLWDIKYKAYDEMMSLKENKIGV